MYEVACYRSHEDLKQVMKLVFDQHFPPDDNGIVRGGVGKLLCLDGHRLSMMAIEIIVKTPCCRIIEDMRSLSHDLYLYQPIDLLTKDASSCIEEMRQQDPRVNAACEKLRTSDAFLAIFEKHLESKWDINDDCSLDLTKAPASRNRQKRKAEASSDSKGNIHIRRMGRMPPESKESFFDGHSPQTSTTSHNSSPFSRSLVPSSGLISSKSLRPKNVGPSAKR